MLTSFSQPPTDGVADAGKAIALALGIGLGALGAGVGIGNIFGSMIQAVARQPELRGELQGIQWLGFALTEAVVFYGLSAACSPTSSSDADASLAVANPADRGRPGSDDLDAGLLRDHVLRAQALRVRADPEDDRRAARPDPRSRRRGRQGPRRGARAARGAPAADRAGAQPRPRRSSRRRARSPTRSASACKEEAEADRAAPARGDAARDRGRDAARARADPPRGRRADARSPTAKVTGKVLDDDDQRRLIDEAIAELDFSALETASN